MAELTESQRRNILQQQGLGTVRDNLYNFGKKSFQSAGPTLGAMFNSGQALFDTIMGDDESAIRNRNERDAYLRRRDAIQSGGLSSTPLSDSQIEGILTKDPNYNPKLDLYTDYVGGKFGNLGNVAESFLLGKGLKDTTEEESLQKFKTLERLNNNPDKYGEFPLLNNEVIDAGETESASRSDGQGFEDIYETIANRPIAAQALKDEKTNLDAFPKLSVLESATAEEARKEIEAKSEAEAGYEDGGEEAYKKELNYGELTDEAILDTAKSKGETVTPATREELLEKYKKEFYEATGLDPSGKANKSSALMAMGLALMQNKAGKGFNVGRMLSAVGEAGEKALPILEKAKATAKAETVAAGKYALGRIQAGESASAALAKEERAFQREIQLKKIERMQEIADKNEEGKKVTGGYFDERLKGLKVRMGMTNNGTVFASPTSAINKVNQRLQATNGGLESVDVMRELANNIINKESTTLSLIADRFQSAFVGFGITDSSIFDGNASDEDKLKALQDSMISRYKKFLTQETGNGISNTDVDRLKKLLGDIDLIGNPATSLVRLDEVKQIFMSERKKVRDVADELMDPSFYRSQEEYDSMDFNKFLDNRKEYKILNPSGSGAPRVSLKD